MYLEKWDIEVNELYDVWKSWSIEKQKAFSTKYRDITLLLCVQIDEQIIKAIIPFWDPSNRCFTFNQENMTLTIEEYKALLKIVTSNLIRSFGKKLRVYDLLRKCHRLWE